jgi:hypothetical protein
MKYWLILIAVILLPDIVLGTDYRTGLYSYVTPFNVSRRYYEQKDTAYLLEGQSYTVPFYLYLPNVVSGTREITIDYMPEYLSDKMTFNIDGGNFRLDWYAGLYSNATFRTIMYNGSYKSSWEYDNPEREFWLGDFSFINELQPGDSLVYTVYVHAIKDSGANHHFYHTRKIVCKSAVITGIDDNPEMKKAMSAFPNPCQNNLTINSQQYSIVSLVDMSGRVLKEIELNPGNNQIDVSGLNSGMYFLRDGEETVKIVKR